MMLLCTATAVQEMRDRLRRGTCVPPRPAARLLALGKSRTATGAAPYCVEHKLQMRE